MGDLFIGVDGGGTKCRARIADAAGRVLGEAVGGPANIGLGRIAWDNILAACREAAGTAGFAEADLARVHAGMGLAGVISDRHRRETEALAHPFASLAVDSDAYAAWLGAHEGKDGAVLILGTGSCGLAVVGGVRHVVGGWGPEISDEASGMALGREAVRRALWAHDGLWSKSAFTRAVLSRFGERAELAAEWAKTALPSDYAEFAPLVFDYAEGRDSHAARIVREAALHADRMIRRLSATGAERISLVGGVAERMTRWLTPAVTVWLVPAARDALDGAILLVKQRAKAGVSSQ